MQALQPLLPPAGIDAAAGDPRADTWLERAHRTLMARADSIEDAALRQMFLTHIPHHPDITALWEANAAQRTSGPLGASR
jgi:hypothetical protein